MVLAGGEAGIGKTALVRHFRQNLAGDVRVLAGGCDALTTPRPLGVLFDLAAELGEEFRSALAGKRPELIFDQFFGILRKRVTPTVVVLEDLHWADDATLDLLRFLGRRLGSTRSLVIATYRDDEVGPRHRLRVAIGDLASAGAVLRLSVPALSREAVARLIGKAGVDPVELHRKTRGNPFFVTELLAARGSTVPATVQDAVSARAARLTEPERWVLDAASVIGSEVDPALLTRLGARIEAIEGCVASGMIESGAEILAFHHELVRDAVYRGLSVPRRRELHRQVLDALEATSAGRNDLATLAHHAVEAGDASAVLRIAPSAARHAAQLSAHKEAHAQYVRALPFLGDLPPLERIELLEAYATECTIVDQLGESARIRREVAEYWREFGDMRRWGLNLSLLSQACLGLGQNQDAETASNDAIEVLERLEPGPELARAYWYKSHLRMLDRDTAGSVLWANRAIELARSLGEYPMLANAHMTLGSTLLLDGQPGGREHLELSIALGREHDLPHLITNAHSNIGSAAGELHCFDEALGELSTAIALAEEHGHENLRLYSLAWLALTLMYRGDWNGAAQTAHTVIERPQVSTPARIMALVAIGRLRARRGDPEAWAVLDEALELATTTGTLQRVAPVRAARAEAASMAGDREAVRIEAGAAFELALQRRHPWFVGELGYWLWTVGGVHELPDYAAEPYAQQVAGRSPDAAASWKGRGCPYEAARALTEGGEESQLRAALDAFTILGARPSATLTARRLRELGVRGIRRGPRPETQVNVAHLTPRESAVLALLAKGLRNNEIARRHSVSARTVDHQVSSILGKLGARSRLDAVNEAQRLGLLDQHGQEGGPT